MTLFRVVTLSDTGEAKTIEWDVTGDGTLLQLLLQDAAGGPSRFVEVVDLTPTVCMWLPENGLAEYATPNPVATFIARCHGLTFQPYFGPAAFTSANHDTGETLPLSEADAEALMKQAQHMHGALSLEA